MCVAEATCGDALPASIPSLAVFVSGLVPNGSLGMIGSNVLRSEQLEFTWGLLCMSQDMLWGVCMCKHMQCGKVPFLYQDLRTSSLECNGKRARATLQAFVAVLMLCKLSSCLSFSHVSSSLSCPSFPKLCKLSSCLSFSHVSSSLSCPSFQAFQAVKLFAAFQMFQALQAALRSKLCKLSSS